QDRHRRDMHRRWYVADNTVTAKSEYKCNIGVCPTEKLLHFSFLGDSDIAYNRLSMTCDSPRGCLDDGSGEHDAIYVTAASNVDIYGNDIRDMVNGAAPNAIRADFSYGNLRVWRNRAIDIQTSFVTPAPMASAPWYVVRNEFVGASTGGTPLQGNLVS